jgi:CheY-like chemotaxis protein
MVLVLLADDNLAACSALRLLLSNRLGLSEIATVGDWSSLMALAQRGQPEIILFDWELPGGLAFAELAALREISPRAHLIALSARPEAEAEARQAGVDAFIAKGDPPRKVLEIVQQFIQFDNSHK